MFLNQFNLADYSLGKYIQFFYYIFFYLFRIFNFKTFNVYMRYLNFELISNYSNKMKIITLYILDILLLLFV